MTRNYTIRPSSSNHLFAEVVREIPLNGPEQSIIIQAYLQKIEVNLQDREWIVYLLLESQISDHALEKLKQALMVKFPELNDLKFVIAYTEGNLAKVLEQFWEEIMRTIALKVPSAKGWLSNARWDCRDENVYIKISNAVGIEILHQKGCHLILEDILEKMLRKKIRVYFEAEDEEAANETLFMEKEMEEQSLIEEIIREREAVAKSDGQAQSVNPVLVGKAIAQEAKPICEVIDEEKSVVVEGEILDLNIRALRTGRKLVTFDITDKTDSISVKLFEEDKGRSDTSDKLKIGLRVKVRGPAQYDKFSQELTIMAEDVMVVEPVIKKDAAEVKRVELHVHTKMSALDSVADTGALIARAAQWGHRALAITDHGVVQAFPEAYELGKKHKIKIIYGLEAYLVNDDSNAIVIRPSPKDIREETYVVFDLETTGLNADFDDIIEIGAVKIAGGTIVERFQTFVRPHRLISSEIIELTGITNAMVENAPSIQDALRDFLAFVGNSTMIAHNASFDTSFLAAKMGKYLCQPLRHTIIDTLGLARVLMPNLKSHKLSVLVKELKIILKDHHRALHDAQATAEVFLQFIPMLLEKGIQTIDAINGLATEPKVEHLGTNHIILLAKNQQGLKNLYRLVSLSHLHYFHRVPRIPKSELCKYREGLIIGSACEAGELFQAYLAGASDQKLLEIAQFYDYLEIQPLGNNAFLLREGKVGSEAELIAINQKIYQLGKQLGKPVVATGDVHFLDPEDEVYRRILMAGQGFSDADKQAPLYFRTTEEMLGEFAYFPQEIAEEVVIKNPNLIADAIEAVQPIPDDLYAPEIEGAEEQIRTMTYQRAKEIYGNPLPEIVQQRLDRELNAIINNGFAVIYLIAHKLVKKSNSDGYLVGSRGSVGSSLVATMCGITEVNPLPPHYLCACCHYHQFITDGSVAGGADLPDMLCPKCGAKLKKEGHDIPFEVFMGFEGDKVPDIDLNFSGEYQANAHKYTEELFGKDYVFRAGTIATIAERTAYGFVKGYIQEQHLNLRNAEINRLVKGFTGVKRTTGQHPGGVMVVPKGQDIHNFTPLQYPADDKKSGVITTHFDYHSISSRLIKLDILGHDDPTVIKMLQDLTGVDVHDIPLDEPKTMSIFSSVEALGLQPEQLGSTVGTLGIPEFGTKFVRQMLEDTRPKTFSELVRISGFSHGTDVWLNNAQDLILEGKAKLSEAISTRDDIMTFLIYNGVEPSTAFKIMEGVRKGKGLKPQDEELMRQHRVPEWFIESCKKIKYLFPKAHAVAYVMMAFRIAYFKVYYPEAFYAAYFTVRADEFDAQLICQGMGVLREKIEEIERKGNEASAKEKNLLTILEIALEMNLRGIPFCRVDLYASDPVKFLITGKGLLPPLVALQGLGTSAAYNIAQARSEGTFRSLDDLRERTRISKTVVDILKEHGCLRDLPETNQLTLFG